MPSLKRKTRRNIVPVSAGLPQDAPEAPDLVALRGDDVTRAQEAFDRLWKAVFPAVIRQLGRREVWDDEAQDVAQDVAARLWRLRRGVDARTPGAWYALVRKTVSRNLVDRWAAKRPVVNVEPEIPARDLPFLDALVIAAEEVRRVFEGADRLWLGVPAEPADAEVGPAGLVLVLLDGLPADEVERLFDVAPGAVARWQADPALVARAVYAALCWADDGLAGHVLRPTRPLTTAELDALAGGLPNEGGDLEGWTPGEGRAVCLRVRNGLEDDQIVRAVAGALSSDDVADVIRRLREAFPFRTLARALLEALAASGQAGVVASPGLWRRVAFEYHARRSLSRDQILERTAPPAEEAGVRLGATTLDNWLSRGRLYAQLASFLQEAA